MARVFVAMSGGVDSSVAAGLLAEQGHDVLGVTMQLLPSGDFEGGCCSTTAVRAAKRVCDAIGIPHYTLNVRDVFRDEVVEPFCDAYAEGRTPNPCILCNDRVKFVELWRRVAQQGADLLATGHYARILTDERGGRWLSRGLDAAKDQSYFLYRMTAEQLGRTLFPVGELTKPDVRRLAEEWDLPTARTPESQEVCFVPADDTAGFVSANRPGAAIPGPIVGAGGDVLGKHRGLCAYTVGQRRRLGVGGAEPLYVTRLDAGTNTVVVGPSTSLEVRRIRCDDVVWRGPDSAEVTVQVRYRQKPVRAHASREGDSLVIQLVEPVAGVAPGQAAVCYNGDVVLGGGVVEETR